LLAHSPGLLWVKSGSLGVSNRCQRCLEQRTSFEASTSRKGTVAGNNGTRFLSNHAGGVLGGISTGQPVVARFAVKPTSSILSPRQTVDRAGADIMTRGRHDPCVGIRAVPVGEAMMACVLADHFLRHRGQVGG